MAHQTEAACLLQTGAMYRRRLGLCPASTEGEAAPVFAGFKPGAFSLYFGDEPIFHFDLEGRWQRAYVDGIHYLKGLDTAVAAIERVREGPNLVLRRRGLTVAETTGLDDQIRSKALEVLERLGTGELLTATPPPPAESISVEQLRGFLENVTGWDAAAWLAHRERYRATYGQLGFLPPEANQSVIVQSSLGDADGVTFGLGPASDYGPRTVAELEAHARNVATLLGKRLAQARTIFLAGSDLLRRPGAEVLELLDAVTRVFAIRPNTARPGTRDRDLDEASLAGFLAFLDRFEGPLPDRAAWSTLRARHLTRVVLGIESGACEIRELYGKTWTDEALSAAVADMKAAGIAMSVVLLVGAGGALHAERHEQASVRLLNALPLGPGDLVYLVDADEVGGQPARDRLQSMGVTPLMPLERTEQQNRLLALLAPMRKERKAKVAPYNLEKQWS
jgi:hypothetical protein